MVYHHKDMLQESDIVSMALSSMGGRCTDTEQEAQAMEAYQFLSLSKENADIINPKIPTMCWKLLFQWYCCLCPIFHHSL